MQTLFVGLDRDKDLTYNKQQEVGIWEGIHCLFIDIDKMIGVAGLCVERYCEMHCKKDILQERYIAREIYCKIYYEIQYKRYDRR